VQVKVAGLQAVRSHCSASVSMVHSTQLLLSVSHTAVSVKCAQLSLSSQPVQVLVSKSQLEASGVVQWLLSRQLTHLFSDEQNSPGCSQALRLSSVHSTQVFSSSSSLHTGVSPSQASHGSMMVPPLPSAPPPASPLPPLLVSPSPSPVSAPPLPVSPSPESVVPLPPEASSGQEKRDSQSIGSLGVHAPKVAAAPKNKTPIRLTFFILSSFKTSRSTTSSPHCLQNQSWGAACAA